MVSVALNLWPNSIIRLYNLIFSLSTQGRKDICDHILTSATASVNDTWSSVAFRMSSTILGPLTTIIHPEIFGTLKAVPGYYIIVY